MSIVFTLDFNWCGISFFKSPNSTRLFLGFFAITFLPCDIGDVILAWDKKRGETPIQQINAAIAKLSAAGYDTALLQRGVGEVQTQARQRETEKYVKESRKCSKKKISI